MLLFNYCLLLLQLFVGVVLHPVLLCSYLCPFQFCYHLAEKEDRAVCFTLVVFLMLFGCLCSLSFPHGALGWTVVCDCGISWSYPLILWKKIHTKY